MKYDSKYTQIFRGDHSDSDPFDFNPSPVAKGTTVPITSAPNAVQFSPRLSLFPRILSLIIL
jgi:hypothetical protein